MRYIVRMEYTVKKKKKKSLWVIGSGKKVQPPSRIGDPLPPAISLPKQPNSPQGQFCVPLFVLHWQMQ